MRPAFNATAVSVAAAAYCKRILDHNDQWRNGRSSGRKGILMSDDIITQEFWRRVDDVIALANDQVRGSNIGEVSTSLLCAVARFNAFNVANTSSDSSDMQNQKDESMKYFAELYRKLLENSFDDYVKDFESHRSR